MHRKGYTTANQTFTKRIRYEPVGYIFPSALNAAPMRAYFIFCTFASGCPDMRRIHGASQARVCAILPILIISGPGFVPGPLFWMLPREWFR